MTHKPALYLKITQKASFEKAFNHDKIKKNVSNWKITKMVGHLKPVNYKVGIFILCGFFLLLFLFGDHSSEVNLQSPDLVAKEVVSKSISTSDITVTKILSNVTSGQEFNGKRFRTFQGVKRFENVEDLEVKQQRKSKWNCSKWGVVTTIFPPSESVRRFLYRDDWCVVVVGDKDKPKGRLKFKVYENHLFYVSEFMARKFK